MQVTRHTTSISSGQTTSGEVDLYRDTLCGISIPASFTGTTITFLVSTASGGTFQSMRDGAGNAYSKTVAAGQYIPLSPSDFSGVQYLKIVSGSSEGADRVVVLHARKFE